MNPVRNSRIDSLNEKQLNPCVLKDEPMKHLLYSLTLAALLAGSAQAQISYDWWGLDAYTTLTYTTASINVPTGYWNGAYAYSWGGYNWAANQGWWYSLGDPNVSPYVSGYGLGWGAYTPWFGFADWYDYTYSSLSAETAYTWSFYDVHPYQSYVWDIYTGVNGAEAIPFDGVTQASVAWSSHYWSYDGGQYIGLFSPNIDVIASDSAIEALLIADGADLVDIEAILNSQVVRDVIANNANGLGNGSIFVQFADINTVPEPATVSLFFLAGLALVIRRKL